MLIKNLSLVLVLVFTLLFVYGVTINNNWIWTLTPWLIVLSARLRQFAKANRLAEWSKMILPRWSTVWIGTWLIFYIAYFIRR